MRSNRTLNGRRGVATFFLTADKMRARTESILRLRPLLLVTAAAATVLVSCGHDVTAPASHAARVARAISFNPRFPEVLQVSGAGSVVPFTKVRVVLHHSNGSIALDTVITFPADADELTIALAVTLLPDAPDGGEPMELNLAYINAAGDTVFRGGPVSVLAVPAGVAQPAPVNIPVSYSGPGSGARIVSIAPRTLAVAAGDPFAFTATTADANGGPVPNAPIVWTSLDPSIAALTSAAAGAGTAKQARGTARIVAQLLTTGADTVVLTVLPKAGSIAAVSGGGQSSAGGLLLPQPVVVKVTATDGLPMAGVSVSFSAANGGTVGSPTQTTSATGLAQTTWTLGPALGAQSLTATVTGIPPVTFAATSTAGPATKLVVTAQPSNGFVGGALANIDVTAQDASGNVARSFTGPVTFALAANPGGATLRGTATVSAVAGVASFATLTLDKAGTGYTMTASAPGLTSTTTSPFSIIVAPATALGLQSGGGQTGPAGSALPAPIVIQLLDAAAANMALAGVVVTVNVTSGGGSVAPVTALTDADGRATFVWTLGLTTGPQSIVASAAGLAPVAVTAFATPPTGQLITWNGGIDTSWINAANWTPNRVPGSSDTVFVGSAPNTPVVVTPTSIRGLYVGGCSTVRVANTLTINGTLADSSNSCLRAASRARSIGNFSDTGTVILTGNGTLMGFISTPAFRITGGTHTLSSDVNTGAAVLMSGSAQLVINGRTLTVGTDFTTAGSATVVMTDSADFINVNGTATFGGGDETGLLTAGVLSLNGDFAQTGSPTAFSASGGHMTLLASDGTQNVAFANPGASAFQDLEVMFGTTMVMGTDATVRGTLSNGGSNPTFSSSGAFLLTAGGLQITTLQTDFTNVRLLYTNGVPGSTTFDNANFSGFAAGFPSTFFNFNRTSGGPYNFNNLTFTGTLGVTGRYVANTGTVALTLTAPNPATANAASACGCINWFTAGIGGIIWP